jgi:hypothetical protein
MPTPVFVKGNQIGASTRWKKGQSGYPAGGHGMTDALRSLSEMPLVEIRRLAKQKNLPVKVRAGIVLVMKALTGDMRALTEWYNRVDGLPLPHGVDASDVKVEVVYVEQSRIEIAEAASSPGTDRARIEEIQRMLPGQAGGQDALGPGSVDSSGAGG